MICRSFAFFASILSHAIDIVKLLYNWKKKDFRMLDTFIFFCCMFCWYARKKRQGTCLDKSKQVSQSVMIWPRYITFKNPLDNSGTRVHSSRVFAFSRLYFEIMRRRKKCCFFVFALLSFQICWLFKGNLGGHS